MHEDLNNNYQHANNLGNTSNSQYSRNTPSSRSPRSVQKYSYMSSPHASSTSLNIKSSPTMQIKKSKAIQRKSMSENHRGFDFPPHIDRSRSTGNVSIVVGKQLLLSCRIPYLGNESVSGNSSR